MWTDNETDRDFLNFSTVATTVSEIIARANGQPVSIGVSGSWGVGKSSMIKLVQANLKTLVIIPTKKNIYLLSSMLGCIRVTTMLKLR